jgi:multicomponent Na+:H+ antiporter subunit B
MSYNSQEKGMTIIVKTITRITVGLILLYGIYITLHGHISPGGGFAGGVIIALSFIHLMLAFGKEEVLKRLPKPVISILESSGAILFLSIAILGFVGGYFFLDWFNKGEVFNLFSGGTIPLSNIAISLKVSLGLFGIFLVLILFKSR